MAFSELRIEMGEDRWREYQKSRNTEKVLSFKSRNQKLFAQRAVESRRRRKQKLIDYKGGKCERCGYNKPIPNAFVFHHNEPEMKEFTIAYRNYGYERMKIEVDKCTLLCCNCHAEIHHEIFIYNG